MFDGSTAKRKKIKVSGKSKARGKRSILQNAEKDRKRREASRTQNKAAIALQSFWRGRQAVRIARRTERAEFNSKLAAIEKLGDALIRTGRPFCPPISVVIFMVRSLLYFYANDNEDDRRRCVFSVQCRIFSLYPTV